MRASAILFVATALLATPARAQDPTANEGSIEIETPAEWSPGARGLKMQRTRSLRVTGRTTHPLGVSQVVVNDRPFYTEQLADGSWRFDGYVPVDTELDSVRVNVVAGDGQIFGEAYPLAVELPDAAATDTERWNSALSGFQGERWAVVVGISDYAHEDIPDLRFAHRDAQQFAQFLRSPAAGLGGFDPNKVMMLTNEDATYRNLRIALRTFLKQPTENDVVYIFWAGHGTPDPDRLEDLYLLPYDADPNDIAATAIPMEDLLDAIQRTAARDKIVITDACHSAGVGMGGTRAVGGVNQINDAFLERLARSTGGSVAITSSLATQISREGLEWGGGHGVFTHHILEGLRGQADRDEDGIVDVLEMFDYAKDRVQRDTQNGQVPTISQSAFNPSWPMAAVYEGADVAFVRDTPEEEQPAVPSGRDLANLMDGSWAVPDSMNAFIGVSDTIAIHLNGRAGPRVDGGLLTWQSSNTDVARVGAGGALIAESPGMTTISAAFFNERRVEIAVRVYDRPLQLEFEPRGDTIDVVRGDRMRLSASMELPTGEIVRGVLPQFEVTDTLIVALARGGNDRHVEGEFRALREGTATITGSLAGQRRTWTFNVRTPGLVIEGIPTLLLAGDELDVRALYSRTDGSILGEALGVAWESSDTSVVGVRLGGIMALNPGKARLYASVGSVRDSLDVSVLGDLLLSTERAGRARIHSFSTEREALMTLYQGDEDATDPELSPDGTTIAFVTRMDGDRGPRIYLADSDGTNVRRLTAEKKGRFFSIGRYYEGDPSWSYDGGTVYFTSNRDGNYDVYMADAAIGDAEPERIVRSGAVERGVTASRDGPRLAFERVQGQDDSDVILTLGDGQEEINFTSQRAAASMSRKSPREARPKLLPGGGGLLLVEEEPNGSQGEGLSLFDIASRQKVVQIVRPQAGHEILYAVSPGGDRVAYHQRPRSGNAEPRIVIADLSGNVLQAFNLPRNERIVSLSWGAVSANRTPEGGAR